MATKKMKAKQCNDCINGTVYWLTRPATLHCKKGYKPRFYMPRNDSPLDTAYGWKRVCAEFEIKK